MSKKRMYRKGMQLFHKETKKKILFGKFNSDGSAACLTADQDFLTLSREEIDTDYIAYNEVEKRAKERRRGQAW